MSTHPGHGALAGIALVIAAVACFATLDTTTKYISVGVPVLMALWFRYLFQAVATAVVVLPEASPADAAGLRRVTDGLAQLQPVVLLVEGSLPADLQSLAPVVQTTISPSLFAASTN